jgi:hypothetical protein
MKDPNRKWDKLVWAAIIAYALLALSTCEPATYSPGNDCSFLGNGAEWGADC